MAAMSSKTTPTSATPFVQIDEAPYWKLRCALQTIGQQQAALQVLQADARRQMQAVGLDPDGEYTLDDTTCRATPTGA